MISALRSSVKFHALYTKASVQEKLGRQEDADRTMEAARQTVKDYRKEFESKIAAR